MHARTVENSDNLAQASQPRDEYVFFPSFNV